MSYTNFKAPTWEVGKIPESMNIAGWKAKLAYMDLQKVLNTDSLDLNSQNFEWFTNQERLKTGKITPEMIPQNFEGETINGKILKETLDRKDHTKN